MFRVITLAVQILLFCNIANCGFLRQGEICTENDDCFGLLNCENGRCSQCSEMDRPCNPNDPSIPPNNPLISTRCCTGTTCEPIEGDIGDPYACRPNNNTCKSNEECNPMNPFLKCLPWSGKCGKCRDAGRPCHPEGREKCCGWCDKTKRSRGTCVGGFGDLPPSEITTIPVPTTPQMTTPIEPIPTFLITSNSTINIKPRYYPIVFNVITPSKNYTITIANNTTATVKTCKNKN